MFRCWSPIYVEEENCLSYEDFDPLKEWLVHPDDAQLQNPSDLSNTSLHSHELHYSDVKIEQKDQVLESSIDVKMENVSLVEISDKGQEVVLEESRGGSDVDMKCVKPPGMEDLESDIPNKEKSLDGESNEEGLEDLMSDLPNEEGSLEGESNEEKLEDLKSDLPNNKGTLEGESDEEGLEDLKSYLPNKEGSLEGESDEDGLEDLKSDLPNKEGTLEGESDEEGLEDLKIDLPNKEGSLEGESDEEGLEDLKSHLPNTEGTSEGESDEEGLEDLKNDLPNKEGSLKGESDEEGSTAVETESDSGDFLSDETSSDESDESMSVAKLHSSSEDEDDGGIKRTEEGEEFEEGEVREFDEHRIDFLSDEEGEGPKGPIRSKHEVEDLPPVPMVEVSLQPHHRLLPVGIISSIMGNRVIVLGSVLHSPLDEGSILWVTDTRLPLGLVDEIFGPVKNPYYVVRYNTEEEVPAGIEVGITISFVKEFASQILNEKELYKKGYDASGDNDEEVDHEVEFSDDEEELMHKKSLREGKRAIAHCNGLKQEARFERRKNAYMRPRAQHNKDAQKQSTCAQSSMYQPHSTGQVLPQSAPLGPGSWSSSSGVTNVDLIPPSTLPQFSQAMQMVNCVGNQSQRHLLTQHQDARWPPGFSPQIQNTGLQGDLPMQFQNQNVILNNLANIMAFQQLLQQFVPHQGSNSPWMGSAPSLQPLGQNNFVPTPFTNGFMNQQIQAQTPLPFAPAMQFNAGTSSSLHYNGGNSSSRGRWPHQRGGGRFFDRGGRQSRR